MCMWPSMSRWGGSHCQPLKSVNWLFTTLSLEMKVQFTIKRNYLNNTNNITKRAQLLFFLLKLWILPHSCLIHRLSKYHWSCTRPVDDVFWDFHIYCFLQLLPQRLQRRHKAPLTLFYLWGFSCAICFHQSSHRHRSSFLGTLSGS